MQLQGRGLKGPISQPHCNVSCLLKSFQEFIPFCPQSLWIAFHNALFPESFKYYSFQKIRWLALRKFIGKLRERKKKRFSLKPIVSEAKCLLKRKVGTFFLLWCSNTQIISGLMYVVCPFHQTWSDSFCLHHHRSKKIALAFLHLTSSKPIQTKNEMILVFFVFKCRYT